VNPRLRRAGPCVLITAVSIFVWMGVSGRSGLAAGSTPETQARLQQAFELAYNLDHEPAVTAMQAIIEDTPADPAPYRAIATVTWLNLLFRRGLVLVEHYMGPVSKENVKLPPPPPEIARAFQENVSKSIALAEANVRRAPNDPTALYDLGTAVGLQASWTATIEGKVLGAFGSARRAYNAHERVLELAPARKEAGLIVGTYRYIVGSLVLPARWVAYVAGFGGDTERGLRLIQEAASHPLTATDAKFALVLLLNRERRYDQAISYVRDLQREYPRNRLLWLEEGATLLRAGRASEAEGALSKGLEKLRNDSRPRMFGEEGLWYFKRGEARVHIGRASDAETDLTRALGVETQAWVKGRTHLELGKAADLAGDRTKARSEYDRCLRLCAAANDSVAVDQARKLRDQGYKG
jgi:tetratricopeptide (TPR) repeat protein